MIMLRLLCITHICVNIFIASLFIEFLRAEFLLYSTPDILSLAHYDTFGNLGLGPFRLTVIASSVALKDGPKSFLFDGSVSFRPLL